jgi:hypothetical protein
MKKDLATKDLATKEHEGTRRKGSVKPVMQTFFLRAPSCSFVANKKM